MLDALMGRTERGVRAMTGDQIETVELRAMLIELARGIDRLQSRLDER